MTGPFGNDRQQRGRIAELEAINEEHRKLNARQHEEYKELADKFDACQKGRKDAEKEVRYLLSRNTLLREEISKLEAELLRLKDKGRIDVV